MKPTELTCWKCAASLADLLLPVSRLAKCKSCNADLHVCRMCKFYDTTVSNSCTEPIAEKVTDKQHKNFCGYYQPAPQALRPDSNTSNDAAKSRLDALFGLGSAQEGPKQALSAEEDAKRKLADLFGLKKNDK